VKRPGGAAGGELPGEPVSTPSPESAPTRLPSELPDDEGIPKVQTFLPVGLVLASVLGVILLVVTGDANAPLRRGSDPTPPPPPLAPKAPDPWATPSEVSPGQPGPGQQPGGGDSPPPAPPVGPDPFESWLAERMYAPTKDDLREVLGDWRTGAREREQDLAVDDRLARLPEASLGELDKAAGQLLLEEPASPAQELGLAALLATSGSELAVGYLFEAANTNQLRASALAVLGTVSNPDALPAFAAQVDPPAELRVVMLQALRNMSGDKARELEAQLNE
jgi:hypothetical protein